MSPQEREAADDNFLIKDLAARRAGAGSQGITLVAVCVDVCHALARLVYVVGRCLSSHDVQWLYPAGDCAPQRHALCRIAQCPHLASPAIVCSGADALGCGLIPRLGAPRWGFCQYGQGQKSWRIAKTPAFSFLSSSRLWRIAADAGYVAQIVRYGRA